MIYARIVMSDHLHIVTLNVPYPPDYGGMIDSYYRIKALHDLGVKIHLHCFEYGRTRSLELNRLCEIVHYYPRKTSFWYQFSILPYIIFSRRSVQLLDNLINDQYPILFDGLHSTYYLNNMALANRKKLVRVHNIEHKYYRTLARFETNLLRKIYFLFESIKLKRFENILDKADSILTVSVDEQIYFSGRYGNSIFIPSFHPYDSVSILPGKGEYVLYHGDLSIRENDKMVHLLISHVFSKVSFPCIIAGRNPSKHLQNTVSYLENVTLIANPSADEMNELIANAQIHLLPVLENNGLKLKLLLALYGGRHCVVNDQMVDGTYLKEICHVANSYQEMVSEIQLLMIQFFTSEMIEARQKLLQTHYNNQLNGRRMMDEVMRF